MTGLTDEQYLAVVAEATQRSDELTALLNMGEDTMAANGYYPVSVVYGEPETPESADLVFKVLPALAEECGPPVLMRGGNDYATYVFYGLAGPGQASGKDAAARFATAAAERAESWWRVTLTARPQFR